jgi:hypothetical protein
MIGRLLRLSEVANELGFKKDPIREVLELAAMGRLTLYTHGYDPELYGEVEPLVRVHAKTAREILRVSQYTGPDLAMADAQLYADVAGKPVLWEPCAKIISWAKRVYSGQLFVREIDKRAFEADENPHAIMDEDHPNHSKDLAAAVKAWNRLYSVGDGDWSVQEVDAVIRELLPEASQSKINEIRRKILPDAKRRA